MGRKLHQPWGNSQTCGTVESCTCVSCSLFFLSIKKIQFFPPSVYVVRSVWTALPLCVCVCESPVYWSWWLQQWWGFDREGTRERVSKWVSECDFPATQPKIWKMSAMACFIFYFQCYFFQLLISCNLGLPTSSQLGKVPQLQGHQFWGVKIFYASRWRHQKFIWCDCGCGLLRAQLLPVVGNGTLVSKNQ